MPGHPKCCSRTCCITPSFTQMYVGSPTTECIVQVADTSITCNNVDIVSRSWVVTDRDDNTVKATSISPVFTFTIPKGKGYQVTLTVTDENGCTISTSQYPNCIDVCPCFGAPADSPNFPYPQQIQATFPSYETCTVQFGFPSINVRCLYPGATILMNFNGFPGAGVVGPSWRGLGPSCTLIGKCDTNSNVAANASACNTSTLSEHTVILCGNVNGFGGDITSAFNSCRGGWRGNIPPGGQFCSSMHIEIPPNSLANAGVGPVIIESVP